MSNFIHIIENWNSFDIEKYLLKVKNKDIENILTKDSINELEFLSLLSPTADNYLEKMANKAHKITKREFGNTIQIYAPLYISNYCTNKCAYCGFSHSKDIVRNKLSMDEITTEAKEIYKLGVRHILILTGGDRVNSPFSYIKKAVIELKKIFDSISIEVYALAEDEYKELHRLGVDNLTIYQETYNKNRYKEVHLAGEKRSYSNRIQAPSRAASAGFRSVNLGALLGLDNPVIDFFKSGIHTYYIMKNYPGCNVSISLPRIRKTKDDTNNYYNVPDKLMVKFITAYRIFIPKAGISISTRENLSFRNNILPLGVTKMSGESKTTVGGYKNSKSEEQFEISDSRTIKELHNDLVSLSFQPVYKDWNIL